MSDIAITTKNFNTNFDLEAEKNYWKNTVAEALHEAKRQGATGAEVAVASDIGFSVSVRLGEVETVEHNRDKGLSITVYFGQRKGSAHTSDTSSNALTSTVQAACEIARLGSEDPFAGLPDVNMLAMDYPDCDLYYPWNIDTDRAIEIAQQCETHARQWDKRIINSDGASVGSYQGLRILGNSLGFMGIVASSRHSISCGLVGQDVHGMQRDGYYTSARDAIDLESITKVAEEAAQRTVSRLDAKRLPTCQVPVIFHHEVASGLINNFLAAIAGGNLYRKSSFLIDHLGKAVFAPHVQIQERPHILKGLGSAPFDGEGVITRDRDLVKDGVLQSYMLSSYSARKLGLQTTGNAGGAHNILLNNHGDDLQGLLKKMQRGLLVMEVMGQGVNIVTGDYSRGASGFWIENGEIQYPVEEITIAGNLADMFKNIIAIGNDVDYRSSILTGSILLEKMMIAGE